MKRLLLIPILLWAGCSFGQIVDQFNYATALDANGWLSQGGTAGQIMPVTTPGDVGNNLSFSGLATSVGNRATLVAGNNQDINKGISGITGTGYYSFLLKVTNTTNLTSAVGGEYFIGFGNSNATNLTVYGGRVYIKAGAAPNTFQLGVMNTTGGTPTPTFHTTEYPVGTTVFVVVKLDLTTSPYTASLFVDPVPGAVEPVATVTNTSGTSTTSFTTFASIFLRQAGSAAATTGNLEIDEIRAGSTWASVTPASGVTPCTNTTATIDTASCAASYTVPSGHETYMVAGTYNDTIPNALGCDSILTINLTFVASIDYYADTDGDGLGDANDSQSGCTPVPGYVTNDDDCDDTDPLIGAGTAYYPDTDGDGLGDNSATATIDCDPVTNYVTNNNDCDDTDDQVGAGTLYYTDSDGDGHGSASATGVSSCILVPGSVTNNDDCNDNDDTVYPGATEIPNNGIDEDCDGSDLNTVGTALGIYEFTGNTCALPVDTATSVQPNITFGPYTATGDSLQCVDAADVINRKGFNTDAVMDLTEYYHFAVTPDNCYGMDLNMIKFNHRLSSTGGTPTLRVRSSLDNFTADLFTKQLAVNGSIYMLDTVQLTAAFDNVTSTVEFRFYITDMGQAATTYRQDNVTLIGYTHALPTQTYYADTDGDTYGDPAATQTACTAPAGYVSDNTDCDDTDAEEFPGAVWYADTDGDGLGNAQSFQVACLRPANHVSDSTDCNDADDQIGAEILYYADADGDTYGDADDMGTLSCIPVTGSVTNNEDCDDSDDAINPDATEVCDGVDNNCDGNIDEGFTMTTYYEDADGDTYGDAASSVSDCTQPAGYVTNDDDCDDANAAAHPGATDNTGNGVDENCDGVDGVLGIEESILAQLNVYPNPGTSSVVLDLASGWNGFEITFIGVDGKEIGLTATQKSLTELEFNTNSLVQGTYFIRLTSTSGTALVRWVKN